jgi:hypothetical protein
MQQYLDITGNDAIEFFPPGSELEEGARVALIDGRKTFPSNPRGVAAPAPKARKERQ